MHITEQPPYIPEQNVEKILGAAYNNLSMRLGFDEMLYAAQQPDSLSGLLHEIDLASDAVNHIADLDEVDETFTNINALNDIARPAGLPDLRSLSSCSTTQQSAKYFRALADTRLLMHRAEMNMGEPFLTIGTRPELTDEQRLVFATVQVAGRYMALGLRYDSPADLIPQPGSNVADLVMDAWLEAPFTEQADDGLREGRIVTAARQLGWYALDGPFSPNLCALAGAERQSV